jgi:hypothetical protein
MPNHRIDRASFDQISQGMSLQEVQSLLRCPPGKYCSSSALVEFKLPDRSVGGVPVDDVFCEASLGAQTVFWAGDHGVILVILDADDKVEEKYFATMYAEGLLTKARKWLASVL